MHSYDWSHYPLVEPYSSYDEYRRDTEEKRNSASATNWPIYWKVQSNGTFEEYNTWTKDAIAQRSNDLVKINWLNVYNSSLLRRDGLIGFGGDCLHHNLPGPRDAEVHLAYSALLDLAQAKIVSQH